MGSRTSGMWMAMVLAAQAACYDSSTVDCPGPEGRVCPAGTICTSTGCATADQVAACRGEPDGIACVAGAIGQGLCRDQVCYASICGDGFVVGSEQCDGSNLGGVSDCLDLGFYHAGPYVACTATCTYDTSRCTGFCGDGILDAPPEQCDGTATTTCQDRGFTNGGTVSCAATCMWDVSGCS